MILSRLCDKDKHSAVPHSGYIEISHWTLHHHHCDEGEASSSWQMFHPLTLAPPLGDPVTPSTGHATLKTAESASLLRYKITLIFSACVCHRRGRSLRVMLLRESRSGPGGGCLRWLCPTHW